MSGHWVDDTEPVSKLKCIACLKSQRSLKGWYEYLYKQICPECFDKLTTGSKQEKVHVMGKLHWCFIYNRSRPGNISNSELEPELRKAANECGLIICDGCKKDIVRYRYYNGYGEEGFYCSECFKKRRNIKYAGFSYSEFICGPFGAPGSGR